MEYLDLTPYAYAESALPMAAVGWLGREHGVQGTAGMPLTAAGMRLLRAASTRVSRVTLGWHECEFCAAVEGNGEYRYHLPGDVTCDVPTMIVHYVRRTARLPATGSAARRSGCGGPATVGRACRTALLAGTGPNRGPRPAW